MNESPKLKLGSWEVPLPACKVPNAIDQPMFVMSLLAIAATIAFIVLDAFGHPMSEFWRGVWTSQVLTVSIAAMREAGKQLEKQGGANGEAQSPPQT